MIDSCRINSYMCKLDRIVLSSSYSSKLIGDGYYLIVTPLRTILTQVQQGRYNNI